MWARLSEQSWPSNQSASGNSTQQRMAEIRSATHPASLDSSIRIRWMECEKNAMLRIARNGGLGLEVVVVAHVEAG